jgi:Arc/MetJ-type ribon-helix-helix transcriptional regulator
MVSFEMNNSLYEQLEQVRVATGKSRSELLREGLKLLTSYYEQNLKAVTDKLTMKNVLSELMKQL